MKKGTLYWGLAALGVAAIVAGLLIGGGEGVRLWQGICLGVGAGLFAVSVSRIVMLRYERAHPQAKRQGEIDAVDERNIMLRNMAKATTVDILQWLIMLVAVIGIVVGVPLWVVLSLIGVFLAKFLLEMFLLFRYQKEF